LVTHGATEKLTEEFVFKKGVRQIFRKLHADVQRRAPRRPSSRRIFPAVKVVDGESKYEYASPAGKMFQDSLKG